MRLIAWNANFNNHRTRSFDATVALLDRFHADILVLSETVLPIPIPNRIIPLATNSPALVVVARGEYTINQIHADKPTPSQSGFFDVRSGLMKFVLAAVWPVKGKNGPSYHQILGDIFSRSKDRLRTHPIVAAGDFNSNTRVKAQRATHPRLVGALQEANLISAYHHHANVEHGEESLATYVQGKARPRPFHIDYCFVSTKLSEASTVTVPQAEAWKQHSDHFPLVLDIPDSAIRAAEP